MGGESASVDIPGAPPMAGERHDALNGFQDWLAEISLPRLKASLYLEHPSTVKRRQPCVLVCLSAGLDMQVAVAARLSDAAERVE